jgi:dTDP-4-amino-4,6-dideoxygalactose transaminase
MLKTLFSSWPSFTSEEADSVRDVLLSGNVNYWTGSNCRKFESEFSKWSNSAYAIALMNGSVALDVALKALKIGLHDEVIVTPRSFIASVSCVVNSGATPVFTDVDIDSGNITSVSIEKALTPKTKAIICVHLAGFPCDMDSIMELAKKHNLYVIEDCSQSHGARYKGKSTGSIGHIGIWSFCQDKIMTTGGEGGMVTTNDESLWRKMWEYKDHGKSYKAVYETKHAKGFRWLHESFGTNWRMTEMQAAIGRIQLKRMLNWHKARLNNANIIWSMAKKCKGLRVPEIPDYMEHAAYKCYVYIKLEQLKDGWNRERIIQQINDLGVPCDVGGCSEIYLEKAFDGTGLKPKERLLNARELGETSLMFLVHPTLTKSEIQQTCDAIIAVMDLAVT